MKMFSESLWVKNMKQLKEDLFHKRIFSKARLDDQRYCFNLIGDFVWVFKFKRKNLVQNYNNLVMKFEKD